ncbi:MAG: hypothetical protein AAF514_02685 [Verrucomicrobiota bacterium]
MLHHFRQHLLISFFAIIGTSAAIAQEAPKPAAPPAEMDEARFSAMLKGATLKGTWAAVGPVGVGDNKKDGYEVVEARKVKGDNWVMVSKFEYGGQMMQIPVPVVVKFAGDTAVMFVNNLPTGDGATWSARILYHDDVYTGSWWEASKKKGGILSGVIVREGEKESKKPAEGEKKDPGFKASDK